MITEKKSIPFKLTPELKDIIEEYGLMGDIEKISPEHYALKDDVDDLLAESRDSYEKFLLAAHYEARIIAEVGDKAIAAIRALGEEPGHYDIEVNVNVMVGNDIDGGSVGLTISRGDKSEATNLFKITGAYANLEGHKKYGSYPFWLIDRRSPLYCPLFEANYETGLILAHLYSELIGIKGNAGLISVTRGIDYCLSSIG